MHIGADFRLFYDNDEPSGLGNSSNVTAAVCYYGNSGAVTKL